MYVNMITFKMYNCSILRRRNQAKFDQWHVLCWFICINRKISVASSQHLFAQVIIIVITLPLKLDLVKGNIG